jgi:probable addiction module antidote protein
MSKDQVLTRIFDVSNYLIEEADIAAYLRAAREDGDPLILTAALSDVAKSRGMSQLAKDGGLSPQIPYKGVE